MVSSNEKSGIIKAIKDIVSDLIIISIILLFVGFIFLAIIGDDYDNLVTLNQGAKSNESIYTEMVNQVGQEVEVLWEPFTLYLTHEQETITKATKYRAAYNTAVNEGNTVDALNNAQALNTIFQAKILSVAEAPPQQMVSARLAEQTQIEMKGSVSKMNGAFSNWTNNVGAYNTARNKISGKIAVMVWGRLLGTNLPEEMSYYKFSKMELNVTGTLSRR